MSKVKVIVLRTAGTNCDVETAYAFERVGGLCELVHINRLISSEKQLGKFHILAIPGGFTYGDDIASGKILANEIKYKLKNALRDFIRNGKLIIGICNGFQVLVKAGFLPNTAGDFERIEATLSINDSGKFEDRWVYLKNSAPLSGAGWGQKSNGPLSRVPRNQKCVWTRGIGDIIYLPVAHGEGKFIPSDKKVLEKLKENAEVVFKYCDMKGDTNAKYPWNPNGSVENIAGICDPGGRIFGLMPHPERHIRRTQHPQWTRIRKKRDPDGLLIFQNGVKAASKL